MISTPIFAFGTPMYYAYPNNCNMVQNSIYQNDNGTMIRNFYAKDAGMYMSNPFMAMYSIQNPFVMNYAANSGGGVSRSPENNTQYQNNRTTQKPRTSIYKSNTNKKVVNTVQKPRPTVTNTVKPKPVTQQQATPEYSEKLSDDILYVANKYSNCREDNGSHHKFCINPTCKKEDPYDQEWCTDFVTYVVKEAYEIGHKQLPKGFGDHDVDTLRNWATRNGMFIRTSNMKRKANFIAENIKPGDIFIMTEGKASHTGFVKSVDKKTGVIRTIEGNRDDMVKEYQYSPNNRDLSGFIRMK